MGRSIQLLAERRLGARERDARQRQEGGGNRIKPRATLAPRRCVCVGIDGRCGAVGPLKCGPSLFWSCFVCALSVIRQILARFPRTGGGGQLDRMCHDVQ